MRSLEEILEYIRQTSRATQFMESVHSSDNKTYITYENNPTSVFAGGPAGPIFDSVKNLFVENGDNLSIQYTGTESNISRVTK